MRNNHRHSVVWVGVGVMCLGLTAQSVETAHALSPRLSAPPKTTRKGATRQENEYLAACESGDTAKVKSLLDDGVSVKTADAGGYSGLHLAIRSIPVIRLLIENRANVNAVDKKGRTPLVLAAIAGQIGAVEELLHADARVDVRDSEGCTALSRAVLNRRPRTVALLIANGANVHIQDNQGRTPRDMAKEVKDPQILKMLEQAVVNPPRVTPKNQNPTTSNPPVHPPDEHSNPQPLTGSGTLRYAQDMLLGVLQEGARSRNALRYFDGKTEAQLRRELESLRREQTRGSLGYRSLSYVLAYYGVDVLINAQRVMYNWLYPDVFGDEPKNRQADPTAEAIKRIYQRNPSDDLLGKVFFVVRQNRVNSEDPSVLVSDMFVQYPTAMLRASIVRSGESRDASITTLARILNEYNGYRRVQRILKDLTQSEERGISSAAQDILDQLRRIHTN